MAEAKGMTKLSNENYEIWRILMEAVLVRKNLHDVAVGTTPRPTTGPNSKGVRDWDRKNAEARAEMILSVDVDQLSHMTAPTAVGIWAELEKVHRARGFATRMALRREFMSMQLDTANSEKMSTWIGRVRSVALRLQQSGVTVEDEDIILVLTMGLPDAYDTLVVSLDSTDPTQFTLDYVIGRLLNEESRKSGTGTGEREAAYRASSSHPRRPLSEINCFKCGKKGHYQINCPDKMESAGAATEDHDAAW